MTNKSAADDLGLLGGTEPRLAAARAAIGVIRIVKESKRAVNTLRLPGVGSGDNCVTTVYFSRTGSVVSSEFFVESNLTGRKDDEELKHPFDEGPEYYTYGKSVNAKISEQWASGQYHPR